MNEIISKFGSHPFTLINFDDYGERLEHQRERILCSLQKERPDISRDTWHDGFDNGVIDTLAEARQSQYPSCHLRINIYQLMDGLNGGNLEWNTCVRRLDDLHCSFKILTGDVSGQ